MSSDLIVEFDSISGLTLFPDEQGKVTLTVTNQGDQQVNGPVTLDLFASTDAFLDRTPLNVIDSVDKNGRVTNNEKLEGTDELLGRITDFAFNLAPGKSTTLTLDFATDELRNPSVVSPGGYYLIGQIDSNNIVVENDETNNVTRFAENDETNNVSPPPPAFVSTEGTDVVLDWNSTLLNAVQSIATRPITSPPFVAHDAAIVHTAIFDAVNAFENSYSPYRVDNIDPPQGASIEAAAVGAAYQTLIELYSPERFLPLVESSSAEPPSAEQDEGQLPEEQFPGGQLPELSVETQINAQAQTDELSEEQLQELEAQFPGLEEKFPGLLARLEGVRDEFDRQRDRSLEEITDDPADEQAGFDFGVKVANEILELRKNDGAIEAGRTDGEFVPGRGLGDWRPTPPDFVPALLPEWGNVKTFGPFKLKTFRESGSTTLEQLREAGGLSGPPPFGSEEYLNDLNKVLSRGEENSTTRTQDETEAALFWSYDRPDTFRPPGQWNQIAQEVTLQEGESRTLVENARLFAQLNTAQADAGIVAWDVKYDFEQLRPITAIRQSTDLDWTPLLDDPPFPDYISGHSTFGGAAAAILTKQFGEEVSFEIPSQELPGITRTFESFDQAAIENALSRVYGGVHVASSAIPVPEPPPFALQQFDEVLTVDQGLEAGISVADLLLN